MIKHLESGIAGRELNTDYLRLINKLEEKFNLKGSVFTKNDGSIKVEVEGEEETLIAFSNKLKKAGLYSSVENFYMKWI